MTCLSAPFVDLMNALHKSCIASDPAKKMHPPRIELGSPAWQARILPLNHQCDENVKRPFLAQIVSHTKFMNLKRKILEENFSQLPP